MLRYDIDAQQASGSNALYLLSAVEMARLLSDPSARPTELDDVLERVNAHNPKYTVARIKEPRKKPDFRTYFGPGAKRTAFKTGASAAEDHLLDFLFREITTLPLDALAPGLAALRRSHGGDGRKLEDALRGLLSVPTASLVELLSKNPIMKRHPRLRWRSADSVSSYELPAYSPASLRLLVCGFSSTYRSENPEAGVYYVVREPRGVFAETPERLAVIVRDVLWLRHGYKRWHDEGRDCFGYYFGALSGDVYEISSCDIVKGGYVHLYGREIKLARSSSSPSQLAMILPPRGGADHEEHRPALMFGAAGKREGGNKPKRPAGGKAVVLTPADAWRIATDLETILWQTMLVQSCDSQRLRLRSHRDRVFALLNLLQAKGHVGVLAAHLLAWESAEHLERLLSLRHCLKTLLAPDVALCVDAITKKMFLDLLNADVLERIEQMRIDPRMGNEIDAVLDGILNSWSMLDSMSILEPRSLAPRGHQADDVHTRMIRELLEAPTVYPRADIMPRSVATTLGKGVPAALDLAGDDRSAAPRRRAAKPSAE